ncbi:molybdenum cofactor guanylyltransferase [Saccharopolyspora griseoalba]|uniref:Molybdenum cofactor guanylyltransferase n=1 Tax=Saccharopolyspora griseoalba TaxID=1431848 RepID=A0ABW2LEZ6_9PSEU
MADFAAVVLAGGRARRLGGVDKVLLPVEGRSLLERTLDAVAEAAPVVVVGPRREIGRDVAWTREEPAGAGPLAALRAGLDALPAGTGLVAVLAADHPHLSPETLRRLRDALTADPGAGGAVLVEGPEPPQWLLGVWRVGSLRAAMPAEVRDRPIRALLEPLAPVRVPAAPAEAADVDTPLDLERARSRRV